MQIIHRYILRELLSTFVMALITLTFVMCIGSIIRAIDLLARGLSGWVLLKVFIYIIPYMLSFTIPISLLASVLLLYSRLSLDGELTAMKACGLDLWQVSASVVMVAIVLSLICLVINSNVAPRSHYARSVMLAGVGIDDPLELLEEGRFVRDFPGRSIYIGKRSGNRVKDVVVYETSPSGGRRMVRATSGVLTVEEDTNTLLVELKNARIDDSRGQIRDPTETRHVNTENYVQRFDLSELRKPGKVRKKRRNYTMTELIDIIRNIKHKFPDLDPEDLRKERMAFAIEANERLLLAFSCLGFALLGIPLGLKSRSKQTSVGVVISLGLVFLYYFFIILARSLAERPELRPDLIQWVPLIVVQAIGIALIRRNR